MYDQQRKTQTVTVKDAARDFGSLVRTVSEHRILVEQDGEMVAALVSPEDVKQLGRLDAYRRDPWSVIDDIHAKNRDKDPEEVERDVAEALAEVRADSRARRERDVVQ